MLSVKVGSAGAIRHVRNKDGLVYHETMIGHRFNRGHSIVANARIRSGGYVGGGGVNLSDEGILGAGQRRSIGVRAGRDAAGHISGKKTLARPNLADARSRVVCPEES